MLATRSGSGAPTTTGGLAELPGLLIGPAPWPANAARLRGRLRILGLPALRAEAFELHIHQHLDVFVEGRRVTVPEAVGINFRRRFISPLHTHDTTGIVHVESPLVRTFTLGEFFGVWGVRFTRTCLGGDCAGDGKGLRVFVNGARVPGDPGRLPLVEHQEIVVAFGTEEQLPRPLPSSYDFGEGL